MLNDYHSSVGDWRTQLKNNERKTRFVIIAFLALYLAIGLVVDIIMFANTYPGAPVGTYVYALITFKEIPVATGLMLIVAVISLLVTYALYDRIMLLGTESHQITLENARDIREKQLYNVVEEMKVAAGLSYLPKIYLIEANYMNAFASGYSEKSAMVAITRGLLEKLDRAELQAVMSHELSHIRHHDIKLTLTVAILSNLMLIVVDMLFYSMLFKRDRRDNNGNNRFFLVILLLRYLLPLLTILLMLFLSRTREYMADAGAVELMRDNEPMARALLKIAQDHQEHATQYTYEYGNTAHEQVRQAAYLFDPSSIDPIKSLHNVFSTHPALEQRLRALGFKPK